MNINNKPHHPQRCRSLAWLLLATVLLTACSDPADKNQTKPLDPKVPGEVVLAPDSPKKAYVKIITLSLSRPPILEPLVGKVTYNESTTSRISSPVAGRVMTNPVALGTWVQTGAALLELNSPEVAGAVSDYDKAQAGLTLAKHAFNRQKELYAGKVISRKELEQAEDALIEARSEIQRAKIRLKNLHLSPERNDGRFALRAPISGAVVERNVNPGQEVRPDLEKPLFVISDIKKLTVIMDVFEINLSKIKLGQKLSIAVPAYPGEQFPASVYYIGQVLDENTRSVQVRCDLPNPDGRLLPGMFATITVESEPGERAIVVPSTAVFTEGDSDFVFVALDENHFQQRPVKIGLRLKDRAVISQGLQAGDKLVAEGALVLRAEEDADDVTK